MALEHLGRGPKDKIADTVASGALKAGDIVVTTGENPDELVLIERDNTPVVIKSRTQKDITVTGVNLSDSIKDGTVIPAGTDIESLIELLVRKRIAATYTAPTLSIANNGGQAATTVEVGTTVNVNLKSTFKQNDAGAITSHIIKLNGSEVTTGTDSELTHEQELVVTDGASIFSSSVAYAEGAIKKDNFNEDSPAGHIAAGSKDSTNFTITGARKAFYGTATGALATIDSAYIRALSGSVLDPKAGSKINITVAEGEQHIVVSLPSSRTLKQVTYVDLGDKGMLEKFTKSTVAVEGASAGVEADNSNVYVYSMAAPAAAAMNFELLLA